VTRSGGWGPLLGDEGSGWSLGREGIKSLLTHHANHRPLLPWHREILDKFGIEDPDGLLGVMSRLDTGLEHQMADSERKKRISGCTKEVIQAGKGGDEEAKRVMKKVAREVVELLGPLVDEEAHWADGVMVGKSDRYGINGDIDLNEIELGGGRGISVRETMLVMGGGLSGVDEFREMVEDGMKERGWDWAEVRVVTDPAEEGVRSLIG